MVLPGHNRYRFLTHEPPLYTTTKFKREKVEYYIVTASETALNLRSSVLILEETEYQRRLRDRYGHLCDPRAKRHDASISSFIKRVSQHDRGKSTR